MEIYHHNQPYYKLKFSELEDDILKIVSFQGEEHISRLFEYRFELISEDPDFDGSDVLNKAATFLIARGEEEPLEIHGIISHFEQRGKLLDYIFYQAVLVPKIWRLQLTYQSEVYQHQNIQQVVTQVLKNSGFSGDDFEFKLNGSYPTLEYVVQYRETNFNFINRRLEHYGIFYYFDHRDNGDVIVFTDANRTLPAIDREDDIYYNFNKDPLGDKETVSEITCQEKVVTGLVKLKDYNYNRPDSQLTAESQLDANSPGMYYEYGDHFNDENEGQFLARVRNQEIIAGSKIFKGKSDCRSFRAGHIFKMGNHYRQDWNDQYILTKVISRGGQRSLFAVLPPAPAVIPTYENYFEAIPLRVVYRPPRQTPVPRIPGIMSAKMESGAGDEYAYIDTQGRYRAKMLFDLSDRNSGEATLPVRLAQSYSGSGYGMHFPNHAGTEMIWACVDGNVDRPLGLGTVPNPSNASPSTGSNKTQSVIRTAGQNELTFDDKTGNENVFLNATKDHNVQVANDKNQVVGNDYTMDVGVNRSKTVGKDEKVSIGNDRNETVGNDEDITIGNNRNKVVQNNETVSIQNSRFKSIANDEDVSIGNNRKKKIANNESITIGSNKTEKVGGTKRKSIGGNLKEAVKGYAIQTITNMLIQTAMAKIQKIATNKTVTVGGAYQLNAMNSSEMIMGVSQKTVGGLCKTNAQVIDFTAVDKIELKTANGKGKIVIESSGAVTIEGTELFLTATEGNITAVGKVIDLN